MSTEVGCGLAASPFTHSSTGRRVCVVLSSPCGDSGLAVHIACGHLEMLWDPRKGSGEKQHGLGEAQLPTDGGVALLSTL